MEYKIGVICAMQCEMDAFRAELSNFKINETDGVCFYEGTLRGVSAVFCVSGVGKVNASCTATVMGLRYRPQVILSTGVAGGIGLNAMQLVIAEKCCQHDIDTTAIGDPKGFISGGGLDCVYLPTDAVLTKKLSEANPDAVVGIIATGDQFIAGEAKANQIKNEFGAVAADCESCAIAQVAKRLKIPFAVIRCISDGADGQDYETFVLTAAAKAKSAVLSYLSGKREQ